MSPVWSEYVWVQEGVRAPITACNGKVRFTIMFIDHGNNTAGVKSAPIWFHLFMVKVLGCDSSCKRCIFIIWLFAVCFVFLHVQQNLAAVLEKEERVGLVNGKEDMVPVPTISSATSTVLKSLFMVLDYLYRDNSRSETNQRRQLDQNPKSYRFLRWSVV